MLIRNADGMRCETAHSRLSLPCYAATRYAATRYAAGDAYSIRARTTL